jgi:hypothetical protein
MSDDRRDAAEASAVDVECEPMTLRLVLSDLTVVETFRGFYEYGDRDMEVEPAHRVMIKAKWKNVWYEYGRSDQRFLLGGKEIDPEMTPLLLGAASSKDDAERSQASHSGLYVNIIEGVFSAFVDTVRRGEVEGATMDLRTEPWENASGKRHRLVFGNLEVTNRRRVDRQQVAGLLRQQVWLLYVIIGLLIAILLRF